MAGHADESNGTAMDASFPQGLIRWAGHRDGGVRRPFHRDSGRPTGQQIETPLVRRLNQWVSDLVSSKGGPRAVLLVGGPGNGKTDAVEGCIEAFDSALGAGGELLERFASEYRVTAEQIPPRKVTIDVTSFPNTAGLGDIATISLVQDATENDPARQASAEELLLDDLSDILDADRPGIFLCCVNRGILASVASLAAASGEHAKTERLVSAITAAATSGPNQPPCWPLGEDPHIAIWPMDVESLVAAPVGEGEQSVAHRIFQIALDERKWQEPCDLKSRCPFCQNRKLLSRKGAVDDLVRLLHYYELASGKRWTFRDIFSLIAYLLVGDSAELKVNGRRVSPCEWAAAQYRLAREGRAGTVERDRAPYLLASRLYHHRLFPAWPSFDRGEHRKAKHALIKDESGDSGLARAKAFFRFMARASDLASLASGDVPDRVRRSFCSTLDPALATGNAVLISRQGEEYSIAQVEDCFSMSIREGLELVSTQIEPLERDILEQLAEADESLSDDRFPRNRTRQARLLQATLRQFAARFAKRSLGARRGVCRDNELFAEYLEAIKNKSGLQVVRKEMRKLLHDADDRFRAGLATTFGQPVAERSRDVALVMRDNIKIKAHPPSGGGDRPQSLLPYLVVKGHAVALTFDLFRALGDVSDGLHEASLPPEIYSLLDRVKSMVSGKVVRDPDVLADEPTIMLGSGRESIDYVDGRFEYTRSTD